MLTFKNDKMGLTITTDIQDDEIKQRLMEWFNRNCSIEAMEIDIRIVQVNKAEITFVGSNGIIVFYAISSYIKGELILS